MKLSLPLAEQLPTFPKQTDYTVDREGLELLTETLPQTLIQRELEAVEILKTVTFDSAPTPELQPVKSTPVEAGPDADQHTGGLMDRILQNAQDFSEEGEGANGVTIEMNPDIDSAIGKYAMPEPTSDLAKKRHEKHQEGTQSKIANQDIDGSGSEFDDGGANVATADIGANTNLYSDRGRPVGNWGDDDTDDTDREGRAAVGLEDEMDDATNETIKDKSLIDDDD